MARPSMGHDDLYPVLPVLEKMRFIHTVVDEAGFISDTAVAPFRPASPPLVWTLWLRGCMPPGNAN